MTDSRATAERRITLTGYICMVSEYWEKDGTLCGNCDMQDEPGRCALLHDQSIPDGDCAGLLARDGVKQPEEA